MNEIMVYDKFKYAEPIHAQIGTLYRVFFSEPAIFAYRVKKYFPQYSSTEIMDSILQRYKRSNVDLEYWKQQGIFLEDIKEAYINKEFDWTYLLEYRFFPLFGYIRKDEFDGRVYYTEMSVQGIYDYNYACMIEQYEIPFNNAPRCNIRWPITKLIVDIFCDEFYNKFYPKDEFYIPSHEHKRRMNKAKIGAKVYGIKLDYKQRWVLAFLVETFPDLTHEQYIYPQILSNICPISI